MIKYKAVGRLNPAKRNSPMKYYATTVLDGEVNLQEICREIEKISTASEADIMAVLTSLVSLVPEKLVQGKIVRLGDLGSFRPSIGSDGMENESDVAISSIRSNKILFKPGKRMMKVMKGAEYKKAKD